MATTPNMSLTKWAGGDYFSRSALSANFDAIDAHDHSGAPKGTPIPTAGLQNLAVTSPKLADSSVVEAKIGSGAVSAAKVKGEAWTQYSPGFGTLGTGGVSIARYITLGKTVIVQGSIYFGTGCSVPSTPSLLLPYATGNPDTNFQQSGPVFAYDTSAGTFYNGIAYVPISSSTLRFYFSTAMAGPSHPFAWAAGDSIRWSITYETA